MEWARSLNHPFTETIILQAIAWFYFQEDESSEIKEVCQKLIGKLLENTIMYSIWMVIYFQLVGCSKTPIGNWFFEKVGKYGGIVLNSIYHLLKSRAEMGLNKIEEALITVEKAIEVAETQHN